MGKPLIRDAAQHRLHRTLRQAQGKQRLPRSKPQRVSRKEAIMEKESRDPATAAALSPLRAPTGYFGVQAGTMSRSQTVEQLYTAYRVLRKYLNQNPVIGEYFDKSKFRNLCKKQ
jgi:hypothetical protein